MVKFIFITVIVTELFCFNQTHASETRDSVFLKSPMVQWNGNRMTGELKKVPVSKLLKDLISDKDFDCEVNGQLPGTISIRFENFTAEEIVHKIMHNKNYNYTILSASKSADIDNQSGVGKLTIYQGDTIVRFSRVPRRVRMSQTSNKMAHSVQPTPSKKVRAGQTTLSSEQHKGEVEKLNHEFKAFLDDMLESKKMSKEEYEKALADMNTKVNIN